MKTLLNKIRLFFRWLVKFFYTEPEIILIKEGWTINRKQNKIGLRKKEKHNNRKLTRGRRAQIIYSGNTSKIIYH